MNRNRTSQFQLKSFEEQSMYVQLLEWSEADWAVMISLLLSEPSSGAELGAVAS